MDQIHVIRHKVLVEGQSQRAVAQEVGVSRVTVRKYVAQTVPERQRRSNYSRPVLDEIQPRLEELLEDWKSRTTAKQRITAVRLHEQLRAEGFKVGQTTVRRYLREWRRKRSETFVPLVHRAGDEAQVDFFEVTLEIGGERCKRWMLVLRLMYSGRDFAWLYERCDQVSFFDGHVRAFAHFGGVPVRCIYDNLSPAVRKVMFPGRQLTARFMALASHYLFEPCFARPGTGHDKGGIEGRGKAIRYQHLVPIPRGDSLDELATQLQASLDESAQTKKNQAGRTVAERFVEEQPLFRPLPNRPFEPRLAVPLTVNSKALVTYDGATYSVPSHWRSLEVQAYIGPSDVRFMCRDELQIRRRVGRREKNIQYTDYLLELRRKPQAVRQVAPELLSAMSKPFTQLWQLLEETHGGHEAGRIFAKVLGAVVDHGEQTVANALHKAIDGGQGHLLELGALIREPPPADIEVPEPLRQYVVEAARATDFDHLLSSEEAQ
jgi:transposase